MIGCIQEETILLMDSRSILENHRLTPVLLSAKNIIVNDNYTLICAERRDICSFRETSVVVVGERPYLMVTNLRLLSLYIGFVSQVSFRPLIKRNKALIGTNLCIILHLTACPATRSTTEANLSFGRHCSQLQP